MKLKVPRKHEINWLLKETNNNVHSTTDPQNIDSLLIETNNNVYSKADLRNVELLLKQKINNATSTAEMHNSILFASALCHLIKKYCKGDAEKYADRTTIGAIKESLRDQLTSIASKLLSSEHFHFNQLSEEEQHLWRQFDKSEIY
jgi:hypothetical protein